MKLEEAIEGLDTLLNDYHEEPCPLEENALKLGIEALKRCQRQRIELFPLHIGLLPGETKD